jgi:hypothetical protein
MQSLRLPGLRGRQLRLVTTSSETPMHISSSMDSQFNGQVWTPRSITSQRSNCINSGFHLLVRVCGWDQVAIGLSTLCGCRLKNRSSALIKSLKRVDWLNISMPSKICKS